MTRTFAVAALTGTALTLTALPGAPAEAGMSAMVSAGGRLFYIWDEGPLGLTDPRYPAKWSLIARDAFNGSILWKRPMTDWGWEQWHPRSRWDDRRRWHHQPHRCRTPAKRSMYR